MTIRVVLQSIEKASILIDNVEKYANIGRGVIIYISFLGEVDETALHQAVHSILTAKIFQFISSDNSISMSSLHECQNADILIIPQASLGGKLKGRNIQFHALVNKTQGSLLYEKFCQILREERGINVNEVDSNGILLENNNEKEKLNESELKFTVGRVINGTYGNRQGLKFESEGPLTHFLDL